MPGTEAGLWMGSSPRLGERKANTPMDITLEFEKIWEVPRGIRKR